MNISDVMAMTDEELRVSAAELAGWTQIEKIGGDGPRFSTFVGSMPDENRPGVELPDYPNNIASAWKLIDMLAERGDRHIMVRFDSLRVDDPNNPNWTIHVSPDIRMDVDREDVSRAITIAFIVALTNEE